MKRKRGNVKNSIDKGINELKARITSNAARCLEEKNRPKGGKQKEEDESSLFSAARLARAHKKKRRREYAEKDNDPAVIFVRSQKGRTFSSICDH